MKHTISLHSGLFELRKILKAAIDLCDALPDAPAEIRSAVTDHSLSCLGIEEVIELVRNFNSAATSAAHNSRLLEQHIHAAEVARKSIQNATETYRNARLGLKANKAAARHQEFSVYLISNLSRIVAALNSGILLTSIRLNDDRTGMLVTRLGSLITSYQRTSGPLQNITQCAASHAPEPSCESSRSSDTEVQKLLQPPNVAYVLSELHAVHTHAEESAAGTALSQKNTQLLNVNFLSLLLEPQPSHPPHISPVLVSYHSDVIVATRAGDLTRLSQILNDSPELLYCFTIDKMTLMSFAIESGEIQTVQYLLDKGVGVNDTYGRSDTCPLATALRFRHLHITRLLICAGADFHHKNKCGWSPLFYIWSKEDRLSSAGPLLGLLAASTSFEVMHNNVYDKDGWSVMHRAAIYGSPQDVSTLFQLGVDPFSITRSKSRNSADDSIHGYSVLQHVVVEGLADVVKVLLPKYRERFGNIELPDDRGWTLLHMAIEEQHLSVIQLLVEDGADLWAETGPTCIARVSEESARRFTPFSLAESFDSGFFRCFTRMVRKHQQMSTSAKVQAVEQHWNDSLNSLSLPSDRTLVLTDEQAKICYQLDPSANKEPEARLDHKKVFSETTVSGHATSHMGDSFSHYHVTNYNFGGRSSKAKLKRLQLRKKLSEQTQHVARKRTVHDPSRRVRRDGV